jgi:hypothetical protein
MAVDITGTRDGKEWPARHEVIDLPDDEAAAYIYSGICEPAPAAETASDPVEADASDPVAVETASDPVEADASDPVAVETAGDPVEADASDPVAVETAGDPAPAKAEKAAGRK